MPNWAAGRYDRARFHLPKDSDPDIVCVLTVLVAAGALNPNDAVAQAPASAQADQPPDPIRRMVERLDLEKVQGHDQRPDAVRRSPAGHRSQPRRGRLDRVAAQELWLHEHRADSTTSTSRRQRRGGGRHAGRREGEGGSVMFGNRVPTSVNRDPAKQPDREAARAQCAAVDARAARGGLLHQGRHHSP